MDASLLESSYSNIKMIVYFDIINLVRNCTVANELKTSYEPLAHENVNVIFLFVCWEVNLLTLDHAKEPCPYRILDDIAGAVSVGAVGGSTWHFIRGKKSSPQG